MNVIAQNVRRDIEGELQQIERVYGVAVLYACESGSRALGLCVAGQRLRRAIFVCATARLVPERESGEPS